MNFDDSNREEKCYPNKKRKKSAEGLAESLAFPKLQFDQKEELIQLHREQTWRQTGRNAKTYVKYPDFRIVSP